MLSKYGGIPVLEFRLQVTLAFPNGQSHPLAEGSCAPVNVSTPGRLQAAMAEVECGNLIRSRVLKKMEKSACNSALANNLPSSIIDDIRMQVLKKFGEYNTQQLGGVSGSHHRRFISYCASRRICSQVTRRKYVKSTRGLGAPRECSGTVPYRVAGLRLAQLAPRTGGVRQPIGEHCTGLSGSPIFFGVM